VSPPPEVMTSRRLAACTRRRLTKMGLRRRCMGHRHRVDRTVHSGLELLDSERISGRKARRDCSFFGWNSFIFAGMVKLY
jgi:hypothetical protein